VAKAGASQEAGTVKVFIELPDVTCPGSTCTLTYDAARDQPKGRHDRAVARESFDPETWVTVSAHARGTDRSDERATSIRVGTPQAQVHYAEHFVTHSAVQTWRSMPRNATGLVTASG